MGTFKFIISSLQYAPPGRLGEKTQLPAPVWHVVTTITAASYVPLAMQVRYSVTSGGPGASRHVYELTLCVKYCVHQCTEQPRGERDPRSADT